MTVEYLEYCTLRIGNNGNILRTFNDEFTLLPIPILWLSILI